MDLKGLKEKFLEPENEFLEEEMDSPESETLGGSLTNDLVDTQVGTVLKRFNQRPGMAYIQMLGRVPAGKLDFQDRDSRIENEEEFREFISEYDVEMPEIIGSEDGFVEYERVDGQDLNTYLNQAEQDEAVEMGEQVGEFLGYIHENDGAVTDLRINNFMIDYEGDLNFVDAEYFSSEATGWEKQMDIITLVSSLRQVDEEAYRSFRKGFEEKYGEKVKSYSTGISSLTSLAHSALIEREPERVRNAASSISGDIAEYREE